MKRVLVGAAIFLSFQLAHAYETETHALITQKAFERSKLASSGPGSIVNILGLDRLATDSPFGVYWATPSTPYYYNQMLQLSSPPDFQGLFDPVAQGQFERCQMQELLGRPLYVTDFANTVEAQGQAPIFPIPNWLVRGAIREDDLGDFVDFLTYASSSPCNYSLLSSEAGPNGLIRVFSHFYDPIYDRPLTINFHGILQGTPGSKAVDWTLGYVDSFANPPNTNYSTNNYYTWSSARSNFYRALTGQYNKTQSPYTAAKRLADAEDRMYRWATVFRSLGDVVHVLQDGAQPQHTRNDDHSPLAPAASQAFEAYTNARVLGVDATGNAFLSSFFGGPKNELFPPLPFDPVTDHAYPDVSFSTPVRFFTTRNAGDSSSVDPLPRNGLFDYSNRGFFTAGTIPSANQEYQEPKAPFDPDGLTLANGYTWISVPCPTLSDARLESVNCRHLTNRVPDNLNPSHADTLPPNFSISQVPLLAESVLQSPLQALGASSGGVSYIIGLEEMQATGNLAIPRAIAYSANLLNYFFNGVGGIKITPPNSGMYAVLDHGEPHSINAQGYPCADSSQDDGCPIFGFQQVQMNIQNVTAPISDPDPGIGSVTQTFTNGTLVAVARYHRNTCYKPDLSGHIGVDANLVGPDGKAPSYIYPQQCNGAAAYDQGRSAYQEISVSQPLPVNTDGKILVEGSYVDINGSSPTLIQFDFSQDPIPVNATDLFFQVVFNGAIGDTTKQSANFVELNSIAVGSIDVSEPTYLTFMNLNAYFYAWGTSYPPTNGWSHGSESAPYTPIAVPIGGALNICFGDNLLASMDGSAGQVVSPGSAVRLVGIFDLNAPATANLTISYPNCFSASNPDGSCPAAELVTDWGLVGSLYTWGYSSVAAVSQDQLQANYNFLVHIDQSDMENLGIAKGYDVQPVIAGVGVNWGDDFYYSFGRNVGEGQQIAPLQTPFPTTPLTGASGGIVAVPFPNPPKLNDTQQLKCQQPSPYTLPYW